MTESIINIPESELLSALFSANRAGYANKNISHIVIEKNLDATESQAYKIQFVYSGKNKDATLND